jgi:hypothetical protein
MEMKVSRFNAANNRYEVLRTHVLTPKQHSIVTEYLDGLKPVPDFYLYETSITGVSKKWFVTMGDAVGICESKFTNA